MGSVKMDNKGNNTNVIEAVAEGAVTGMQMALSIGASLVAMVALVAAVNKLLGVCGIMQVYQADRYKTLADENRISTRLLIPPRGVIYDRNGVMIATNTQNFQALIVAEQTPNVQETLDAFKKIMPLSADEEEKIKRDMKRNRSFVPIKIKENLTWDPHKDQRAACIARLRHKYARPVHAQLFHGILRNFGEVVRPQLCDKLHVRSRLMCGHSLIELGKLSSSKAVYRWCGTRLNFR